MDELFKLLGFGAPFAYAGATYGLFHWLDLNASDEARTAISRLLDLRDYDSKQVSAAFVEVFDRLYSSRLASSRAFFRSTCITLIVSGIFVFESAWFRDLIWFLIHGLISAWLFVQLLGMSIASLAVNIVSDYASLFFIRAWLTRTVGKPVVTLLIAALIGVLIVAFALPVRFILAGFVQMMPGPFSRNVLMTPADLSPHMLSEAYLPALLFWPGIVVFVWLPLFAAGIVLLRITNPLIVAVRKTQWFLKNGKERPLDAIGLVSCAIVLGVAAAWQVFFKWSS
jgi:hypothetical protein